jgi:hypothetical protein
MSTSTSPVLQNPDPGASYQAVLDALGIAYWDAPAGPNKDLIAQSQKAIADILTQLDEQGLTSNTALFLQLAPKINAVNTSLKTIRDQIANITKDVGTAGTVISAISKVLALFPPLV